MELGLHDARGGGGEAADAAADDEGLRDAAARAFSDAAASAATAAAARAVAEQKGQDLQSHRVQCPLLACFSWHQLLHDSTLPSSRAVGLHSLAGADGANALETVAAPAPPQKEHDLQLHALQWTAL